MLIANLRKFLNKCKTHGTANFVTLKGGKFNIPSDKSQEFLDLYLKASTEFTESDNTSLVWRPTSERFKPLHFDIDLQLLTDVVIPNDIFIELASTICFYIISVRAHEVDIRSYIRISARDQPGGRSFDPRTCFDPRKFWISQIFSLKYF